MTDSLLQVKNATIILPRTGERIRREITLPTLGQPENATPSSSDDIETTPSIDSRQFTRWSLLNSFIVQCYLLWRSILAFAVSKNGKGILKCSLAYLLGTCGTFVPFLSGWLGHQDGKHIVATVTVYFHAARSAGSMIEATLCAFVAFLYAAFLSLSSMGVSILFAQWDMLGTGHIIVLVFFVGGGLGFVAWIKQRLGNPLVNVAASLASLASITVFVKEGSIQAAKFSEDKVIQVLKMVILGIGFTTLINLTVFPESARRKLNTDMSDTTDILAELLGAISSAFLHGSESDMQSPIFDAAMKRHKDALKTLTNDLSESKWEHYILGHERRHEIEDEIVKCLQKLSQSIGGLRSAALVQFDLIRCSQQKTTQPRPGVLSRDSSFLLPGALTAEPEDMEALGLQRINEDSEHDTAKPANGSAIPRNTLSPSDMFSTFMAQLGPPMKSLTHTLILILDELPFDSPTSDNIAINENFHSSLKQAIEMFITARKDALTTLYREKQLYSTHSLERLADYEEIAASCGHFSYALIDLAEEIGTYLELLEDLKLERERPAYQKTYNWLKFWQRRHVRLVKHPEEPLLKHQQPQNEDGPTDTAPPVLQRTDTLKQTTDDPHRRNAVTNVAFRISRFLYRDDVRFAAKVGIGAALLAAPAFIAETRPTFAHLRLEWGLVSYMVVCSMTIGAVNTTGFERFLGTFTGAAMAVIAWLLADEHAVPLAFFGWLMSLFCFYIIVAMKKGPMGRFIFLTYNLSALYAYSISVQDDDEDDDEMRNARPEIYDIVLHRVASVLIGCVWAIIITRLVWPISARRKIRDGMSLLFLRMGLIWKRDPLASIISSSSMPTPSYTDIRAVAELHSFLAGLDALRPAATAEFELRGPFPSEVYGRVLGRTQRMLDTFHGLQVALSRHSVASEGETAVLTATMGERDALAKRICHLFSVLASTVLMQYPFRDDVLPSIEHATDRLLAKVFEFRRRSDGTIGDTDYELIYTYGEFWISDQSKSKSLTKLNSVGYGTVGEGYHCC